MNTTTITLARSGLKHRHFASSRRGSIVLGLVAALGLLDGPASAQPSGATNSLPVVGLHLMAPGKRDLPAALTFIREALPKEGVNTLILEFDYNFNF